MNYATTALFAGCLALAGCHLDDHQESARRVTEATCVLHAVGGSGVSGTLRLEAVADGTRITGEIRGLMPGLHGFHIHQLGDVSDLETGKSAGGHYAPRGHEHGRKDAEHRHVGDLGNIEADARGTATVDLVDRQVMLNGPYSVVGRAFVVHADADRFTQPSGGAGARVAVGVIGIAAE